MPRLLAGLATAAALSAAVAGLTAGQAGADPQDLEPYCMAGQVPTTGACLPDPNQPFSDDAPGANPQIPLGLTPGSVPAI